eukprot:11764935-Alexandrium_andersonii.AAC.1
MHGALVQLGPGHRMCNSSGLINWAYSHVLADSESDGEKGCSEASRSSRSTRATGKALLGGGPAH